MDNFLFSLRTQFENLIGRTQIGKHLKVAKKRFFISKIFWGFGWVNLTPITEPEVNIKGTKFTFKIIFKGWFLGAVIIVLITKPNDANCLLSFKPNQ